MRLDNAGDLCRFFVVSPAACLISATVSLSGIWALGAIEARDLSVSWLTWWTGDTLGVLVILPLMLVFAGEPRALWRHRAPYVAVPMILFFALFAAIFGRVSSWEGDQSLLEFRMRSQHLVDMAQASLQEQGALLEQVGVAVVRRQYPITRQDFRELVSKLLQRFSMIQAIEWAPRVEAADRRAFEAEQAAELPGFAVRERDPAGSLRAAAQRGSYYPVTYLEPLTGNEEAAGFDLASDAARRGAIEAAIASGQVVATAPIRLVQEHAQQSGILLIHAVSSGPNGAGVLLVVLRMGTFTEKLLAPLRSIMTARFVDVDATRPLFDGLQPESQANTRSFEAGFAFRTRRYALYTEPTALYRAEHRAWESWGVLVAGVFSTGLLGALLMLGTGHAHRSQQLVEERTSELQAANRRLTTEMQERQRAESALQQARRMEAIGQLTGGVAHDFNNLLTVIVGNLDLLRRHVVDAAGKRLLAAAQGGAERGARLTGSLLAFARRQPLRPEIVNPNRLIQDFAELLRRAAGEAVELRLSLGPESGCCRVDPAQFQAALLNLVVNARDAMPQGGGLTIETRPADLDRDLPRENEFAPAEPQVAILVRDTGHGMPSEVLERAFEPFYTTKEIGRGSGLGLSQVYGFVTQSGGQVEISSKIGAGTVVTLYLPRAAGDPAPAASDEPPPARAAAGTETILVVEDDDDVRNVTADGLRALGYRVVAAADGPAALALLDRGEPVALLFSDVVMPNGIRGDVLAQQATSRRYGLKVLLTSGYAADLFDPAALGAFALLRKPYRHDELAQAVRAALDRG